MKPKSKREPRTPMLSSLPATFAEAEEAEIIATLERWCARLADKLNSEAGHEAIRDDMLRQLQRGEGASLPVAYIVAMADADRFAELPVQVRAYAQRALTWPPLPIGYPSNRPQVVNDYTRDLAIPFQVDQIVARWRQVPKLQHRSKLKRPIG